MPIDILSTVSGAAGSIDKRFGYVIGHPIWFAMVIVTVMIIMLCAWGFTGWTFKLVFYMMGGMIALLSLHDWVLDNQFKAKTRTDGMKYAISGGHDMQPRNMADIRSHVPYGAKLDTGPAIPLTDQTDLERLLAL